MKHRLHPGDHMPEFSYDTPYEAQNSFYALLEEDERPLFMIFLRNFGHPFTRHYIVRYAQSIGALYSARLVCVVRTRPETIGPHLPRGTMPYPVICDAEGALYDYFEIPRVKGRLRTLSWEGLRILKEAEKQGYEESKEVAQQMPLTLLVAPDGEVLLAHYGKSVTDQPESCEAMETVCQELLHALERARRKTLRRNPPEELFDGEPEDGDPLGPDAAAPAPQEKPAPGGVPAAQEPAPAPRRTTLPPEEPAPKPGEEPLPGEGKLGEMVFGELGFEEVPLPPARLPARPKQSGDAGEPASAAFSAPRAQAGFAGAGTPAGAGAPTARPLSERRQDPSGSPAARPAAPLPAEGSAPERASAPNPAFAPATPGGSAAEDIALQKFRSAAAALFSDEI